MDTIAKALAVAAITAFIISCASGPAQKPAGAAPPPQRDSDQSALPEGKAAHGPEEDSLPGKEGATVEEGQSPDVPLGLPAAPYAKSGPEVETVQSTGPASTASIPLTSPQPPAGSPAKRVSAAARSAPTQADQPPAASRQQEAPTQPPASQAAAVTSQPQPSGAPAAGSPTGRAAASSSAPATYGRLREIYARMGDDLQISLGGEGFLFLGFPDLSPDGISFKGKEIRDGKTLFSFKATKLGTYDLDFLRQDNNTGTSVKETVRVHVLSDADFSAQLAQGQDQPPQSVEPGDPAFAEKLSGYGQFDAAIAELLKGYRDGNPDLNDRIAELYMRTGAYDAAGKYFSKNLSQQGHFGESAVLGLARIAMAQKDQTGLLSLLKRLLAVTDPGLEDALISTIRFEKDRQEVALGIDLASEYLTRYPDGRWVDEADYLLAQLLEGESRFRDIKRARTMYNDILARFPESPFAHDARERIGYIDRHFFQVR